jgi:hypothetical protein
MIDNLENTDILMERLENSLPIETRLSQPLIHMLTQESPDISIPAKCNVTKISYAGDEGGVLCWLNIGDPESKNAHIVSITHLRFDRHIPLAREIDAYQRHRIKKIKQQDARGF